MKAEFSTLQSPVNHVSDKKIGVPAGKAAGPEDSVPSQDSIGPNSLNDLLEETYSLLALGNSANLREQLLSIVAFLDSLVDDANANVGLRELRRTIYQISALLENLANLIGPERKNVPSRFKLKYPMPLTFRNRWPGRPVSLRHLQLTPQLLVQKRYREIWAEGIETKKDAVIKILAKEFRLSRTDVYKAVKGIKH